MCRKNQGNYFRIRNRNGDFYIYNFISPICIINNFRKSVVSIEDDEIFVEGILYDNQNDSQTLKYGFKNYLVDRCAFLKDDLKVFPIIFIKNEFTNYISDGLIISQELNWDNLIQCITARAKENICSLKRWNSPLGFDSYFVDISTINDKASEDSTFRDI